MTNYIKGLTFTLFLVLLSILPVHNASAHLKPTEYERTWGQNFANDVRNDFLNYFDNNRLLFFGDGLIAAGILANTGFDRAFGDHWQRDFRSEALDRFFRAPQWIGCLSFYYAPIFLGTMGIGHLREHTVMGNVMYHWGYRSLRAFILGGLQQVSLTHMLGSGRPCLNQDSKWQPFKYSNAVSGHAFYGAIPLLTAAMMTDPPIPKTMLYIASTLPGLSRINYNKHYLSQFILGWGIAFLSAQTVYETDSKRNPAFQTSLHPRSDGLMLSTKLNF